MQGLTSTGLQWPAVNVAAADHEAGRLTALARTLVDDGVAAEDCDGSDGCALERRLAGLCTLTRELAGLPASPRVPLPPRRPPEAVTADYLRALADAGAVIYVCRRVLHPTGTCLFDGTDGADLCTHLLVTAHRLGGTSDAP